MAFTGKVVAITGAAGGIGQSLCRHFKANGALVAAIDKNPAVEDFARQHCDAWSVTDIGDRGAVEKGLASLQAGLGGIDVLVNNAGFSSHPTFARSDPESWQDEVNGNLNSAYYCAHAVLEGMKAKGGGAIVSIGSVNGLGALGDPAYSAAKAGLSRSPNRSPSNMAASTSAPTSCCRARCAHLCGRSVRRKILRFWKACANGIRWAASSNPRM